MARRHFDRKGFPKLEEIISEIVGYVEGLEVQYTDYPIRGRVVDPRNSRYGERIVSWGVDFVQGIPQKPFRVEGIYVVGGQAAYLPDSYNTGEHDLDIFVRTNADTVTFSPEVEVDIWFCLANILEDGNGCWTLRDRKEFALDLFEESIVGQLEPPYVQIYPIVKKVYS